MCLIRRSIIIPKVLASADNVVFCVQTIYASRAACDIILANTRECKSIETANKKKTCTPLVLFPEKRNLHLVHYLPIDGFWGQYSALRFKYKEISRV